MRASAFLCKFDSVENDFSACVFFMARCHFSHAGVHFCMLGLLVSASAAKGILGASWASCSSGSSYLKLGQAVLATVMVRQVVMAAVCP